MSAIVVGRDGVAQRVCSGRATNPVKLDTFECGNAPSGTAWGRFSVKFYLTAILFIVFDVEVVFMYPWAVVFRQLGWFGFVAMATFSRCSASACSTSGARARWNGIERRRARRHACATRFGDAIVDAHDRLGDETVVIAARRMRSEIFRVLRDDPELAFDFLIDLTAVDYLGQTPRFEVVYHLFSLSEEPPPAGQDPRARGRRWVHSLARSVEERELARARVLDMFGIRFVGHPDLRRILMYEEFVGHPLRKDYPVDNAPAADPGARSDRESVAARADSERRDDARRARAAPRSTLDPIDEIMELQMGPSHPATHGTIKFNLKLDGEIIVDCDVEVGYLHRGFEKMSEQGTWTQVIPYTDRLNYVSPLINNVGFALAVEKLARHRGAASAASTSAADHERDLAHLRPPHLPRHGGVRRSAR